MNGRSRILIGLQMYPAAETATDPKEIEALLAKKKFDEARAAIQLLAEKNPDAAVVHRLEGELLSSHR